MKRKNLLSVLGVVWLLCLGLTARGYVPITVTGPVTICVGNTGTYSISPTSGYHYQWSVTAQGNIPGLSTGSSAGVLWGASGTATVTVDGYDASNVLQEVGTLTVAVQPLPQPTISTSSIAACQNYADTPKVREQKLPPIPGDPHILDDGSGCPKVCDSSVVTYTAHGPAGSTFGWSVVNGTILSTTATTCTVFWTGPVGFGSITVHDTSAYGCVGSKTVCIELIDKPHARFSFTNPGCVNQSVLFTDLSWAVPTSPILNWYWDFGDGGTFTSASSTPASHTYTAPGPYLVKLVVRNQCGCTDTFKQTIKILNSPGFNIVCVGVQCDSGTATYTLNPVPPCPSYHWNVVGGVITAGAGTPTITVLWTNIDSSGFGYVAFTPSGCSSPCTAPTVVRVPVVTPHGRISGPKVVCPNTQYLYSMPQWPTTIFTWTVLSSIGATYFPTDQNNQMALNVHGGPGTIILKCVYENTLMGCGGIAYDTIQVMPPDSIIGNTQPCYKSTATYNMASGSLATWTLTYPDHTTTTATGLSFSATYSQVGTYTLSAVGNFCLEEPLTINIDSLPHRPDSLIGPDTVCFGTPVDFRTAIASPNSIFAWGISSGSLYTHNGNHTTAVFSGSSPATIMVWRESINGAHCHSDTLSKKVYAPNVHVHVTGIDTVCPNTPYTYNAGYSAGETYFWEITSPLLGSVLTNGSVNSSILFNNLTGVANVIVTVTRCGIAYKDSLKVYILPTPALVTHIPDSVCRDASFLASLTGTSGGSVSWNWGDGSLPTPGNPASHAYTTLSGSNFSATIVATVTGVYGCLDTFTISKVIIVKPAPVANISPQGPFYNCSGTFSQPLTATLSAGYGITDSLAWFTPLGVGPTCKPPTCTSVTAATLGNYFVVAVGTNGCADTSNVVQFIHRCPTTCSITPIPTDKIDSATSHCGLVHLHGTYSASPTAFAWSWSWPSQMIGVTSTNTTLDGSFKVAGLYAFHYTVGFADAFGDTCYVQADTSVLVPLIAAMGHLVACSGSVYNVTLADNSNYYPGHNPTSYSWYIDGIYQTNTVAASYTASIPPGSHTLGEWVHFDGTDSCFASDFVFLDSMPHANFSFYRDTTCATDASVQFTNLSTPVTSPWKSLWGFGDGPEGNTQMNPWKVYAPPGLPGGYNVTLRVTNQYGCYDDTTRFVPVIPDNLDGTVTGLAHACSGQSVLLSYIRNAGTIYPEWYYWMNASDTMYLNTSSTTTVFNSGSYWVSGYNHYGCLVTTPHQNVTFTSPPPATITGDSSQCINVPYTLNGYAGNDPSITYKWIKGSTVVGAGPTYTDPAASIGTFTYHLVISVPDSLGGYCTDTSAAFVVTVHALPSPPGATYALVDCNTYTLKLIATGPSYGSYNWSNGMSGQTIAVPEAGGPYKVWYTDTFGCKSNTSLLVPRDPRLYLWVFPSGCYGPYCDGWTASHYIVGPVEPFFYWAYMQNPPGTILSSGSSSPVGSFTPTSTGDYQLILDNAICRDTSNVMDIQLNSQCDQCRLIRLSLKNVIQLGCEDTMPAFPADTCCHWFVTLSFANSSGSSIGISLSATNGSMSPGGFLVPPGGSTHTFQFLRSPGFNGGTVIITMTYTDPTTGRVNSCNVSVPITPCQQIDPRLANGGSAVNSADGTASLILAPNPATDVTRVDYQFSGAAEGSYIEVYDMTGRLADRQEVTSNQGSNYLRLANYRSGMYIVVLRQRGKAILQSRLSVVH